jgi:hypothetical protein
MYTYYAFANAGNDAWAGGKSVSPFHCHELLRRIPPDTSTYFISAGGIVYTSPVAQSCFKKKGKKKSSRICVWSKKFYTRDATRSMRGS